MGSGSGVGADGSAGREVATTSCHTGAVAWTDTWNEDPPMPASAPTAVLPHHTAADLDRLQNLLDDSYRRGGSHLLGIHTPNARVDAAELVRRLPGMHVMVVATVSSDGRPFTGPVDAFLHHGRIHFGTAPTALRAQHLRRRPQVSVTLVEGERLVLTVHGRARGLDLHGEDRDYADRMRGHYGPDWLDEVADGAVFFAVEPDRVLAADMGAHTGATD